LPGERARGSSPPSVDFLVRARGGDAGRQRLQEPRRRINPARRNLADVGDNVL
jgi:hypothetical protein